MNGQNPNNNLNNGLGSNVLGSTNNSPLQNPMPNNAPNMMGQQPQNINVEPQMTSAPNSDTANTLNVASASEPAMQSMPGQTGIPANNINANVTNTVEPTTQSMSGQANMSNNSVNPNAGINLNSGLNQNGPVAVPIPGTEGNGLGQDINPNNFINSQKVNDIGTVPPANPNDNKKKKGMNKTLFAILIIVLIFAVAGGVYYFLNISNQKVKLTPKTYTIGVGSVLSEKVSDYATITKGDIKNCRVILNNDINVNEIGEYSVSIKCGDETFQSKIKVVDESAPQATITPVFKGKGEEIAAEDFVKTCVDPSECSISFVNEDDVKSKLETEGGPYKVGIKTEDKIGNTKDYEAELYVTSLNVFTYRTCASQGTQMSDYQATKAISDVLPIGKSEDGNVSFLNVARRHYKYVFLKENDYYEVAGNKENTLTFDGITGLASYDDEKLTIIISTDLPLETLKSENEGAFPTDFGGISAIYENKGYTCSNSEKYKVE